MRDQDIAEHSLDNLAHDMLLPPETTRPRAISHFVVDMYLDRRLAKHVVLAIAESLAGSHDDGVASVHAERIEVLPQQGKRGEITIGIRKTKVYDE